MMRFESESVAEIVIGNHLASLAIFAVSNNATETLMKIEEMKKGLIKKMVKILDPTKSGD